MGKGGKIMRKLEVRGAPPPTASYAEAFLTNEDLSPVAPDKRTWNTLDFCAFWIADGANLNTFTIAATSVADGLTWWQGWISVIVGYALISWVIVLQSRASAVYHIGFPVVTRSSFGVFGSIWPVLQRAVMACVWQGVQSYLGGECVTLCLRSIWPSYVTRPSLTKQYMGNTVTGYGVLSFSLFNLFAFGFLLPPPQQIRWLFRIKALVTPVAMFGLMIWVLVDAHGGGEALSRPSTVHGSKLGWLWISGCMSCISNMATLSVNMPDFARMATSVGATRWSQLLSMPITFAITSLIGVIIASASEQIYGEQFWNPLDVMGAKLDKDPHKSTARTGVFFIAAMFVLIQIGTNIAANSLSAGSDFTALLSRYVNIRRGSIFCWIVGFAYCPWVIMSSSSHFQTALSAFAVFLASIAGVMVAHYFLVDRGYINVPALYRVTLDDGTRSPYMYGPIGCNWRAYVAYLIGLGVNMAGFVQVVGSFGAKPVINSTGLSNFYSMAYIWGFLVSGIVYVSLNAFWPSTYAVPLKARKVWREPASQSWEMDDWSVPVWALNAASAPAKISSPGDIESEQYDELNQDTVSKKGDLDMKDDPYAAKPSVSATPYLDQM